MHASSALLLSILLLVLALAFFHVHWRSRKTAVLASLACLALLILSGTYVVSDYFTGAGIDEAVVFHLRYGLQGAGFGEYSGLIKGTLLFVVLSALLSTALFWLLSRRRNNGRFTGKVLAVLLLAGAVFTNPASHDLAALYSRSNASVDFTPEQMAEYYVIPEIPDSGPRKNVVFIYLEGLERTYFDQFLFPGLTPQLGALAEQAINFTDIAQSLGMGWTIAGITASQCGLPLYTSSGGNSMSGMDQFLPGAHCLGDILQEEGYRLEFMGGAPLEFAGKGKFFQTHGFSRVQGRDELVPQLADPEYQSSWGLYDDSLFSLARQRFASLTGQEQPFGLFLLNLDTHHPTGHLSDWCQNRHYADGSNPMLNAVHCTDRLVANFIEDIRQSEQAEETLIVVASDHYALNNTATDRLSQGTRRNLFMVIDPTLAKGRQVAKPGSPLDTGATLLSLLGMPVEGLGFGRDLLSGPSLRQSMDSLEGFLKQQGEFLAQMWNFPQLDKGVFVDATDQVMKMGRREVGIPALVLMDKQHRVEQIKFEFSSAVRLVDYVGEELKQDKPFLWVDQCSTVIALQIGVVPPQENWCMAVGTLGSDQLMVRPVNPSLFLSPEALDAHFSHSGTDQAIYQARLDRLDHFLTTGSASYQKVVIDKHGALTGAAQLQSSGTPMGTAMIKTFNEDLQTFEEGERAARGLTLFGFNQRNEPIKLAHKDTCDPQNPVSDPLSIADGSFAEVIESRAPVFGAFAIISHDSAVCSGYDMAPLFAGLDLSQWQSLTLRQPYMALIAGNGETREFVGAPETTISVQISNYLSTAEFSKVSGRRSLPSVAHAGGGFNNWTYTNSLNALNFNADRYKLFEIDFSWTADGHPVCLHDWAESFTATFGFATQEPVTLARFRELAQDNKHIENCTLDTLVDWLEQHPAARLITDTKERNAELLHYLAEHYPALQDRFIPQIYQPDEYTIASELGFEDIIWSVYQYDEDTEALLEVMAHMDLYALTMPSFRVEQGLALEALNTLGIRSYVHTINEPETAHALLNKGIAGVYTDWLEDTQIDRGLGKQPLSKTGSD